MEWRAETLRVAAARYVALDFRGAIEEGVVEEDEPRPPLWLPYVKVADVVESTGHAVDLGASVLLRPREGPVGWRSRILHPAAGHLALWQPKR